MIIRFWDSNIAFLVDIFGMSVEKKHAVGTFYFRPNFIIPNFVTYKRLYP